MNYLLIADAYEPATISAAQQLKDLVSSLSEADNTAVTVLIPDVSGGKLPSFELDARVTLVRAWCLETKNVNHIRRVFAELLLPFFLYVALKRSPAKDYRWDGVIWYSPTIFLGPLVSWLTRQNACRSYLILRDLFPDWAVDAGVMRKGLAYRFLKQIESYQYRQASVIGVQTPANLPHLASWNDGSRRIEVLPNWLAPLADSSCSLRISDTPLAGRRILVYAGNMGVAQDIGPILDLAAAFRNLTDWGFLFVGRGSEVSAIKRRIVDEGLENVALYDEIQPEEIPGLFGQCHIGIVALDPRHTTHNIPGKFIAYMRSGLPVLARVNRGNDLMGLINDRGVGVAVDDPGLDSLRVAATKLITMTEAELISLSNQAKALWEKEYSAESCADQILAGLSSTA